MRLPPVCNIPTSCYTLEFPECAVVGKDTSPRVIIMPGSLVMFDPMNKKHTTQIKCLSEFVSVPTLLAYLESCYDTIRSLPVALREHSEVAFTRELALLGLAYIGSAYVVGNYFWKENGPGWKCIEDLPSKHRRVGNLLHDENKPHFYRNFINK
ncbi:hypothetical protein EJ06DRAFT_527624 [Trichodelitschia bisporula]|uniref:Uncharacterized protein n=1 Tax=Trichodelitschia bisporula TaxID=703511 RepID=A0A6G1I711_9PEZI|nr:hypothetical protein EJ06DRAFT_527624 [Trichodelitschia bisporula]